MAMSNRNNRSIHGDAKRIKADLAEHQKRMAAYIARGFCKLHASVYAHKDMRGVTNPSEAPGGCEECIHGARAATTVGGLARVIVTLDGKVL